MRAHQALLNKIDPAGSVRRGGIAARAWAARHREMLITLTILGLLLGMLVIRLVTADAEPARNDAPIAQPSQSAEPGPAPAAQATTHTVLDGETLSKIALRYRVPMEAIASDNGIVDPNRIRAGQRLAIGAAPTGVEVIQPGTTLSEYAQLHGQTVDALLTMNPHISDPDRILAGSELRVSPRDEP